MDRRTKKIAKTYYRLQIYLVYSSIKSGRGLSKKKINQINGYRDKIKLVGKQTNNYLNVYIPTIKEVYYGQKTT